MKLVLLIFFKFSKRQAKWIGLFFAVLIFTSFLYFKLNIIQSQQSLAEGFVGTYQEHDIPDEVKSLLSQSLMVVDRSGKTKPNLVESWDINNDATGFKFILKQGLMWSDGTRLKSSDIEIVIPNTEVITPDERTIQFKLKEPYSPLPSLLNKPIFKKGTRIGTGPYQLKKTEKSRIFITKMVLEPKVKNLPLIFIRFYPNEEVAKVGFNMGEVQSLFGIGNFSRFNSVPMINLKQLTDYSKIVTMLYNTKDPLLSNRSLRQALSYQAPKVEFEEEANAPYPKSYWVYNDEAKKYLSNNEEAKAAYLRAKSSLPKEKINETITLVSTPQLEGVAGKIVSSWKELGINVNLRIESGVPQNFQVLLITQSIPEDPDQYFLWHSTQSKTNLTRYSSECCPSSARVDKDLEDGRKTVDEEKRKEKYLDFHKVLMEDSPASFLYFPKYNIVYLKKAEKNLEKVLNLQLN